MEITVRNEQGYSVIAPQGRLTAVGAPAVKRQVSDLIGSGQNRIVVDLSGVDFIDSSGLGALIGGLKAARVAGGDLRVAASSEAVGSVLRLTNLDRVLRNHSSVESAFAGD